MVAISRTVVYNGYTLPNVISITRRVEPVEFNNTVIAWREIYTLTGLIQANTNALFQTALDAFNAGMQPTNLDQDFVITVVTDAVTKKRFEYLSESTDSYRRAGMSFSFDGGDVKTELSYPYTATFTWFPPNLTGTGGTEVAGSTTTNQRITYAVDAAGYIQITKTGTINTAKDTSAKDEFESKIAATGFSDSVSSLKVTSNLYKRTGHNYRTDAEDTQVSYTITETETPIQIKAFENLRINAVTQELNGVLILHATAEANINKDKSKDGYKQTDLASTDQEKFRQTLEGELKKMLVGVLAGAVLNRRDPLSWNPQTGRIRIGIHWTLPMSGSVMSFSVQRTLSKDPSNVFAATNTGYVSAQADPLLQRVTYSGNMRTLAASSATAIGALKAIYPAPKSTERQEGPVSINKTEIANPVGDGFEGTISWSITYRLLTGPGETVRFTSPASVTGLKQNKSPYI